MMSPKHPNPKEEDGTSHHRSGRKKGTSVSRQEYYSCHSLLVYTTCAAFEKTWQGIKKRKQGIPFPRGNNPQNQTQI